MGYSLKIGELVHEHHASEDAPLNSNDDHANVIMPSYGAWEYFCRATGLHGVFFAGQSQRSPRTWRGHDGEKRPGLFVHHPGWVPLEEAHRVAFVKARDAYLARVGTGEASDEVEYNRRRLEWLVYWSRWALDHCDHPTFANG